MDDYTAEELIMESCMEDAMYDIYAGTAWEDGAEDPF
jgi:hypothetical protein